MRTLVLVSTMLKSFSLLAPEAYPCTRYGACWTPQLAIPEVGCAYQCTHFNQPCHKRRTLKAHIGDTARASSAGDQKGVCCLLYLAIKNKQNKTCHLQQYGWIEGIMLEETNQTEKDKYHAVTYMWKSKRNETNEQRLIDTENK